MVDCEETERSVKCGPDGVQKSALGNKSVWNHLKKNHSEQYFKAKKEQDRRRKENLLKKSKAVKKKSIYKLVKEVSEAKPGQSCLIKASL